jgi:hypothetical protein
MRMARTFLCLSALALAAEVVSAGTTAAKTKNGPSSYTLSVCSTADLATMLGERGALHNQRHAMVLLLQARIAACKSAINQYIAGLSPPSVIARNPPGLPPLPTASPLTTAPPNCKVAPPGSNKSSNDPFQLYSALTYCVSWIAGNVPSPSASTPTPQPIGFHTPAPGSTDAWNRPVYVLSLASDPLVSAAISLKLADLLRSARMNSRLPFGVTPPPVPDIYSDRLVRYRVLAEPTWTLAQYQQQCFSDPSTAGAIVALQPGLASALFSFFLNRSVTTVIMQLMVIDCEPTNAAYVNNAAYITYLSHVRLKQGVRWSINLSQIIGGTALYYTFTPPLTTTASFKIHPTPVPTGSPKEIAYQTSTNLSGVGIAAVGVAGLSSFNALGDQPSADAQAAAAVSNLLPELIDDVMRPCQQIRPGDSSFAQPQCEWFKYYTPLPNPQP